MRRVVNVRMRITGINIFFVITYKKTPTRDEYEFEKLYNSLVAGNAV